VTIIPAASHPRIDHKLFSPGTAVSRLLMTAVPMVSVAPTNKWNDRRVFSPTTTEKLFFLGNTPCAPYPYYMPIT
jgi:hypothetical protein